MRRRYGGWWSRRSPDIQTSPELGCSKPARILRRVVLPEPLSPKMVRNSPSAISREISRNTIFLPKCFATERIETRDAELGWLLVTAVGSVVVAIAICFGAASIRGQEGPRHMFLADRYCAAFTSFQISLYLARRGTFCQKYRRFW